MSLGKRLIKVGLPACTTDSVDPFDDGSGVALYSLDYDASDESGTYDGTPTDVDFGVGGQINYGARFNGSSSKIDTGFAQNTSNAFTWSLWFKADASQSSNAMIMDTTSTTSPFPGVGIGLSSATDLRAYQAGSASRFTHTNNTITSDTWVHVAYTHDGSGNFNFYINNQLSASGNYTSNLNSSQNILLGDSAVSSWNNFNGDIDQVRIFSEALDSTQVTQLYNETACVYTCTTDTVDYPTTNVAYYKLDNSAEDETGSYDGTESNIEYRFGRFGQAGLFNGTNSYIYASNSVQQPTTNFSVSVWVLFHQIKSSSVGVIGNFKTGVTPQIGWAIAHQNGTPLQFWADGTANSNGGMVQSTSSIPTNEWIHVVGTYDGSNVKIYINGDLENTKSYTQTPATTDQPLVIGRWYGNFDDLYTDGQIDQARIFSSALTDSQVTELYEEKPCEDTSNFKTVLYEGTGATQYISNVGMDLETDGGLVWIKNRYSTQSHRFYDSVRGANLQISSNQTASEGNSGGLTSFDSNGFSLDNWASVNTNGNTYVSWVWKGGGDAVTGTGTGVTNVSISANTNAGFSIVKYTGGNSASDTVNHGLTDAEMIILKDLDDGTHNWRVWHKDLSANHWMYLNLNNAQANVALDGGIRNVDSNSFGFINGTTQGVQAVNNSSNNYIAYVWKSVSGYSKIGSYEGNTTTLPSITLGFKPSFVMVKNVDGSDNWHRWYMFDDKRQSTNSRNLAANVNSTEPVNNDAKINFEANGFSIANSSNYLAINDNGDTYIYMAFK